MITVADLRKCKAGAGMFLDGAKGMAEQHRYCIEHPRFTMVWTRKDGRDRGVERWFVDDVEVPYRDLQAVCDLLNATPTETNPATRGRAVPD